MTDLTAHPIATSEARPEVPARMPLDCDTLRRQITNGVLMSLGAHNLIHGDDLFQFVAMIHPRTKKGTRAGQPRKMRVRVSLTPMDLYRVQVDYVSGLEWVTHWEDDSVYGDELARTLLALDSGTECRG